MRKIILFLFLFFNLIPIVEKGKLSLVGPMTITAQTPGDEKTYSCMDPRLNCPPDDTTGTDNGSGDIPGGSSNDDNNANNNDNTNNGDSTNNDDDYYDTFNPCDPFSSVYSPVICEYYYGEGASSGTGGDPFGDSGSGSSNTGGGGSAGGGGDNTSINNSDPSSPISKQIGVDATNLLNQDYVAFYVSLLRNSWGLSLSEEGFGIGGKINFGTTQNPDYRYSPYYVPYGIQVSLDSSECKVNYSNYSGSTAHTHLSGQSQSISDMYNIADMLAKPHNVAVKGGYVIGQTPATDFYMGIVDSAKVSTFIKTYPRDIYEDTKSNGFTSGKTISTDYNEVMLNFFSQDPLCYSNDKKIRANAIAKARTYSLAYILEKYNTGFVSYGRDANGIFRPIKVIYDPKTSTYSASLCY